MKNASQHLKLFLFIIIHFHGEKPFLSSSLSLSISATFDKMQQHKTKLRRTKADHE